MTHVCVGKLTIIGSDNGLSPGRRQAIIWTNAGILLIGTLGRNFSEILIEIRIFSFKKVGLKVSSVKWRPFCLGLNVLKVTQYVIIISRHLDNSRLCNPILLGIRRETWTHSYCRWDSVSPINATITDTAVPKLFNGIPLLWMAL